MMISACIRILIAEDHALVRELLTNRLGVEDDMEVIAAVGTAEDARRIALEEEPDVVLMDIEMPGLSSFDAARSIQASCARTRIVFLTAFDNDLYIEQALALEGAAYVTKSESPETIMSAVRAAHRGHPYFSPSIRKRIAVDETGVSLCGGTLARISMVTPREMSVLVCIARGLSNKEIAGEMHISVKTVEHHCEHLMAKLEMHDRVRLTRFAIREGLVIV